MDHESTYDLLELYVFGNLEPEEETTVEAHLETACDACHARIRELRELSARLAEGAPPHDPPPRVREQLLEAIRTELGKPDVRPGRWRAGWPVALLAAAAAVILLVWTTRLRDEVDRLRTDLGAHQERVAALQEEVSRDEMDRAAREEELAALRDAAARSAGDQRGQREEIASLREKVSRYEKERLAREDEIASLQGEVSRYEDATVLLGQPGMHFLDLTGVDPNPQAFGKVVIDPDRGTGVVYMYRLPPSPKGMEYQLWMMREGRPTSVGTFTVASDGSAVMKLEAVPESVDLAAFKVTIEPEGGMPQPTGMMYLTGPDQP